MSQVAEASANLCNVILVRGPEEAGKILQAAVHKAQPLIKGMR